MFSCGSIGKYDWDNVSDFITENGKEDDVYFSNGTKFADATSDYIFNDESGEPRECITLSREEKTSLDPSQHFVLYFQANYYALSKNYIVGFSFEWDIYPFDKDPWELKIAESYFFVGNSEDLSFFHFGVCFGFKDMTIKDGEYVSSTTYSVPVYPEDNTQKPILPNDGSVYQNNLLLTGFSKTTHYLKDNNLGTWY